MDEVKKMLQKIRCFLGMHSLIKTTSVVPCSVKSYRDDMLSFGWVLKYAHITNSKCGGPACIDPRFLIMFNCDHCGYEKNIIGFPHKSVKRFDKCDHWDPENL